MLRLPSIRGINEERSKVGLVALRSNPSLGVIAGKRSANMVAGAYFSHTEPDGDTWLDYLEEADVPWYSTGETIAWDRYATLDGLGRHHPQGLDRLGAPSGVAPLDRRSTTSASVWR